VDSKVSGPANTKDARTIPQLIRAAAKAYGDDLAVTLVGDTIADDQVTYIELDRQSALLARGLLAAGFGKGSRIGFMYGNGPRFAVLLAAISRMGAVAVPISTLIKSNELVRVLRQSDIAALFVQRKLLGYDLAQRVVDAMPALAESSVDLRIKRVPFLRSLISTGDGLPTCFRTFEWLETLAESVDESLLEEAEAEVHPSDQAIEIYTSGSMALPKGVKHLHGPILHRSIYIAEISDFQRGAVAPAPLPMFWVGGLSLALLPAIVTGGVTRCGEATMTSSRHAVGSVMAPEDLANIPFRKPFWALGMSETFGPYSYGNELRLPGFPLCSPLDNVADRYEVRVADKNDQPVGDGQTGEVQVRGYAVTPGLHKVEREGYFTADGYYHTGDLGLVDGDRIHFVGRAGDMLKTAGSNVSPSEVEFELQEIDGVQSAYVIGLPDKERGQLLIAVLVASDGATLDFPTIEATLKKRLSSYKVPRAWIEFKREEVPMLASNKVARREIEKMVAERLGRPATV
jgi:acyl-CoA synthetase (AMP-forming)/AMP-acid ligase II